MEFEWKVGWALPVLVVALLSGVLGCDDSDNPEAWIFFAPDAKELAGLWTGEARITGEKTTGGLRDGFTFPVALDLRKNQTFTLRSFGYPVSVERPEDRTCSGVFRVTSREIEFFPNTSCLALPVYRYTIGHFAPRGLTLRGERNKISLDTRVEIQVERDSDHHHHHFDRK